MSPPKTCRSCGTRLQPNEEGRCSACRIARRQGGSTVLATIGGALLAPFLFVFRKIIGRAIMFLPKLVIRFIKALLKRG